MAPRILERGLTGLFRSRWGVALVIAALVLAVVGIGRIFADGETGRAPLGATSPAPALSVNPDDADSVPAPAPPRARSTRPGTAPPERVAYALAAARADQEGGSAEEWHDRRVPNATKSLSDELAGTDPAGVPASWVEGRP